MATYQVGRTETTDMTNNVTNYSVAAVNPDSATGQTETEWMNTKASQYLGYYKKIPELHAAITAFATWIVGKGYKTLDAETQAVLDHINGWGEDTFNSIIWNLMIQKKVYGDAFAEIIRDKETGTLINLKPLDPAKIKIIADEFGIIKRYEQMSGNPQSKENKIVQKFQPNEILHLCNNRVVDEIHGTSIIEACENVILWKNQAMEDLAIVSHRNVVPVRILEVDTDDEAEITKIRVKYETAIKNKEVIIVPKGTVSISSDGSVTNAIFNPMPFINYLDDFFYRALGVPRVVMGGGQEFTESSSKISYLSYSQIYTREQTEFMADLWNQCFVRITLEKPISIQNELLTDENKDAGQMGAMQPNDMTAGSGQ
jgi:hypothetical protein